MARSSKIVPSVLALLSLTSLVLLQCNRSNCEELRDELTQQKAEWTKCSSHEDCAIIGGNVDDCSGIFSCNVAVHRRHRLTAERRIASLPEESVDCMVCGTPNCPSGELPYCEPVSGRCMIISELLDGNDDSAGSAAQNLISTGAPDSDPLGEGGQGNFGTLAGQAGGANP